MQNLLLFTYLVLHTLAAQGTENSILCLCVIGRATVQSWYSVELIVRMALRAVWSLRMKECGLGVFGMGWLYVWGVLEEEGIVFGFVSVCFSEMNGCLCVALEFFFLRHVLLCVLVNVVGLL